MPQPPEIVVTLALSLKELRHLQDLANVGMCEGCVEIRPVLNRKLENAMRMLMLATEPTP